LDLKEQILGLDSLFQPACRKKSAMKRGLI